mgnify:CR=1 FL=1
MEFKFRIGQIVTTVESIAQWKLLYPQERPDVDTGLYPTAKRGAVPLIMFVLERRFQECPGGSQTHYLCTHFTANGYVERLFNEIELVAHPLMKEADKA